MLDITCESSADDSQVMSSIISSSEKKGFENVICQLWLAL